MMDAVLKPVLYLPFYNFPLRYLDRKEWVKILPDCLTARYFLIIILIVIKLCLLKQEINLAKFEPSSAVITVRNISEYVEESFSKLS